ncbi:MAG: methylated-DNA--[protein]-cysteine S-methyltransferase [Acutalibacteraceae bacterium]
MKYYYMYSTDIGNISIAEENGFITDLHFAEEIPSAQKSETEVIFSASSQLKEYLNGSRKDFDLPLKTHGTDFEQSVWRAVQQVNYGTTETYKQMAQRINKPYSARAVGNANNKNPILIFIPCHRIIGSDGSLKGYAAGAEIKKYLLELEKRYF